MPISRTSPTPDRILQRVRPPSGGLRKPNAGGLTQLSGETATGIQQTTFNAMASHHLLAVLSHPRHAFGDGASGPVLRRNSSPPTHQPRAGPPTQFAMFHKAPPATFLHAERWASGYGASNRRAATRTLARMMRRARIAGTAVGRRLSVSPNTLAGVALAGAGTIICRQRPGLRPLRPVSRLRAYLHQRTAMPTSPAALAYGWQDITRIARLTVPGSSSQRQLQASLVRARRGRATALSRPYRVGRHHALCCGRSRPFYLPASGSRRLWARRRVPRLLAREASPTAAATRQSAPTNPSAWRTACLTVSGRLAWAQFQIRAASPAAPSRRCRSHSFVVNGGRGSPRLSFRADYGIPPNGSAITGLSPRRDLRRRVLERHTQLRRQGRCSVRDGNFGFGPSRHMVRLIAAGALLGARAPQPAPCSNLLESACRPGRARGLAHFESVVLEAVFHQADFLEGPESFLPLVVDKIEARDRRPDWPPFAEGGSLGRCNMAAGYQPQIDCRSLSDQAPPHRHRSRTGSLFSRSRESSGGIS